MYPHVIELLLNYIHTEENVPMGDQEGERGWEREREKKERKGGREGGRE